MKNIEKKFDSLKKYIKDLESVIIAYSGGVDSTFLLKVCRMVLGKDNLLAVTSSSPSRPAYEMDEAIALAKEIDVEHVVIYTKELEDEKYHHNPYDRCYHCKKYLNQEFYKLLKGSNYKMIINGTNADEFKEYRPGLKADKEFKVLSPLLDSELTKEEIRILSKQLNLRTWDKPSKACLSTRIPVSCEITEKKLKQIEESEKILINMGFDNVRVRHMEDTARIEIDPAYFSLLINEDRRLRFINSIKKLGFKFVTLDLSGYRSGNMSSQKEIYHHNS